MTKTREFMMMASTRILTLGMILTAAVACKKDQSPSDQSDEPGEAEDEGETLGGDGGAVEPSFSFGSDVAAVGLTAYSASGTSLVDGSVTTNMFALDPNGQRAPAAANAYVGKIFDTSIGLLLDLSVVTKQCLGGCYGLAKRDGTFVRIPGGPDYIGESAGGDLVFGDSTRVNLTSTERQPIQNQQTGFRYGVSYLSGAFVLATKTAIPKVTQPAGSDGAASEEGESYDDDNPNPDAQSPTVVSLSSLAEQTAGDCPTQSSGKVRIASITDTKVLVINCGEKLQTLDVATGDRKPIAIQHGLNFAINSKNRAIGLADGYANEETGKYYSVLMVVSDDFTVKTFDQIELDPIEPEHDSPYDLGWGVIHAASDHAVVREKTRTSLINLTTSEHRSILSDVALSSLTMNDNAVYFTGTDASGKAISGQYSFKDDTTKVYEDGEAFSVIEAVNRF